jgi:hypothetical protein
MAERRNPAPATVAYYKRNAEGSAAQHDFAAAYWSLREAFNHLENAAYAEAEEVDRLKAEKVTGCSSCNGVE